MNEGYHYSTYWLLQSVLLPNRWQKFEVKPSNGLHLWQYTLTNTCVLWIGQNISIPLLSSPNSVFPENFNERSNFCPTKERKNWFINEITKPVSHTYRKKKHNLWKNGNLNITGSHHANQYWRWWSRKGIVFFFALSPERLERINRH